MGTRGCDHELNYRCYLDSAGFPMNAWSCSGSHAGHNVAFRGHSLLRMWSLKHSVCAKSAPHPHPHPHHQIPLLLLWGEKHALEWKSR